MLSYCVTTISAVDNFDIRNIEIYNTNIYSSGHYNVHMVTKSR
jgi:hypothetical protein